MEAGLEVVSSGVVAGCVDSSEVVIWRNVFWREGRREIDGVAKQWTTTTELAPKHKNKIFRPFNSSQYWFCVLWLRWLWSSDCKADGVGVWWIEGLRLSTFDAGGAELLHLTRCWSEFAFDFWDVKGYFGRTDLLPKNGRSDEVETTKILIPLLKVVAGEKDSNESSSLSPSWTVGSTCEFYMIVRIQILVRYLWRLEVCPDTNFLLLIFGVYKCTQVGYAPFEDSATTRSTKTEICGDTTKWGDSASVFTIFSLLRFETSTRWVEE